MDLPEELTKVRKHLERSSAGIKEFAHILSYIATESIESVVSACAQAIKMGTISKDVILNILLRNKNETKLLETKSEPTNYNQYHVIKYTPSIDFSIYDNLLNLGGK
jgi:hypothetical protein